MSRRTLAGAALVAALLPTTASAASIEMFLSPGRSRLVQPLRSGKLDAIQVPTSKVVLQVLVRDAFGAPANPPNGRPIMVELVARVVATGKSFVVARKGFDTHPIRFLVVPHQNLVYKARVKKRRAAGIDTNAVSEGVAVYTYPRFTDISGDGLNNRAPLGWRVAPTLPTTRLDVRVRIDRKNEEGRWEFLRRVLLDENLEWHSSEQLTGPVTVFRVRLEPRRAPGRHTPISQTICYAYAGSTCPDQ